MRDYGYGLSDRYQGKGRLRARPGPTFRGVHNRSRLLVYLVLFNANKLSLPSRLSQYDLAKLTGLSELAVKSVIARGSSYRFPFVQRHDTEGQVPTYSPTARVGKWLRQAAYNCPPEKLEAARQQLWANYDQYVQEKKATVALTRTLSTAALREVLRELRASERAAKKVLGGKQAGARLRRT